PRILQSLGIGFRPRRTSALVARVRWQPPAGRENRKNLQIPPRGRRTTLCVGEPPETFGTADGPRPSSERWTSAMKKLILVAVIGILAVSAAKGSKWFSYVRSELTGAKQWAESQ